MTQKTNITIEDRRAAAADRERTGSVVMGERMKVKKRSTFETLIKFGTDASGLERTFRLLQALAQCISNIRSIRSTFIFLLHTLPQLVYAFLFFLNSTGLTYAPSDLPKQHWYSHSLRTENRWQMTAVKVRSKLAQGRRFFRVFRFLESFHSAFTLYQTSSDNKDLATWLDISAKSFNGMYLLFETLVFFPAVGLGGLEPWSMETSDFFNVEGQRFWLFALVCGALGGMVRLWNDWEQQVEDGSDNTAEKEKELDDEKEKRSVEEDEDEDEHGKQLKEEERQRAALEQRKEKDGIRKGCRMRILRRIAADLLDIPQPGAVVGWTPFWPGTVGVMMVGSTLLTGMEVWEKCSQL